MNRLLPLAGVLCMLLASGCSNPEQDFAACKLEALKLFGNLRAEKTFGRYTEESKQELEYVSNCMEVKGYAADLKRCNYGIPGRDLSCWENALLSRLRKVGQ